MEIVQNKPGIDTIRVIVSMHGIYFALMGNKTPTSMLEVGDELLVCGLSCNLHGSHRI